MEPAQRVRDFRVAAVEAEDEVRRESACRERILKCLCLAILKNVGEHGAMLGSEAVFMYGGSGNEDGVRREGIADAVT